MKLLVLSDLHVEFAAFQPDVGATKAADVVILAGDIHKGIQGMAWARLTFPNKEIIYVAGNHEFYGQHWELLLSDLRLHARQHQIHFLENDSVSIDGVRFLGASLWTDFEYFGATKQTQMMRMAENSLNDFRLIQAPPLNKMVDGKTDATQESFDKGFYIRTKLTPEHTVVRHQESLAWLKCELEKGDPEKTVVVTHHYPNKLSTAEKWVNDPITAAFGSELSLSLLTQAKLWIHGHTHHSCDYEVKNAVRSVRVVCNPRGYPQSRLQNLFENSSFNSGFIVEIEN